MAIRRDRRFSANRRRSLLVGACWLLSLATGTLTLACSAGQLGDNGRITPCHGHHTSPEDCGRAQFNAPLLPKIQLGQSKDEVLAIMRHPAERFEAKSEHDHKYETWIYMQNYDNELMTAIVFTDGKVTEIKTVPWKTE